VCVLFNTELRGTLFFSITESFKIMIVLNYLCLLSISGKISVRFIVGGDVQIKGVAI
jgi:hypothetical protein